MQTPRSPPIASSRIALVDRDNPHKEVRFARDSPLEGAVSCELVSETKLPASERKLGSDFGGFWDNSGIVKTLSPARISSEIVPLSRGGRFRPPALKFLFLFVFPAIGVETAREFTVYKKRRLDHTTPQSY